MSLSVDQWWAVREQMGNKNTPRVCCVLCGVWLFISRDYTWGASPWTAEYCAGELPITLRFQVPRIGSAIITDTCGPRLAVYSESSEPGNQARLSGPGSRTQTGAEIQASPSNSEPRIIPISLMGFGDGPDLGASRAYGFPFHKACWDALTDSWSPCDREIQLLYDLCRSVPLRRTNCAKIRLVLDWGHGYDGLYKSEPALQAPGCEEDGDIILAEIDTTEGTYYEDPRTRDFYLKHVLKEAFSKGELQGGKPTSRQLDTGRESPQSCHRDVFRLLPVEIRQMILENLSLPDTYALRQASRSVAELGFNDQFWISRFLPGRDFAHIFEARPYLSRVPPGQWRAFSELVKVALDWNSMLNRARVLGLASSLRNLMLMAEKTECAGDSGDILHLIDSTMRWATARPLKDTAASLYDRSLLIPTEGIKLFASMVDIYGGRYVSGIRIQQTGKTSGSWTLGYQHPLHEVLVHDFEEHDDVITGFCLAVDHHSVRGLSVITRRGALTDWAGEHEGLARRKLRAAHGLSGQDTVIGLRCAFDVSDRGFLPSPSFYDKFLTVLFAIGSQTGFVIRLFPITRVRQNPKMSGAMPTSTFWPVAPKTCHLKYFTVSLLGQGVLHRWLRVGLIKI